jgi:hypothetical protein
MVVYVGSPTLWVRAVSDAGDAGDVDDVDGV